MFHEMRIYEAEPAKFNILLKRFQDTNSLLFKKYNFNPIAFWSEQVGTPHRIIYVLSWEDWDQREKAWEKFYADSEWSKSLEENGSTVTKITSSVLKPLHF
jgi:hypothetical protein|tara:strand:+ start:198 stop:500 length:303 start_codon:yes stop_codon:yes gene_type:complete